MPVPALIVSPSKAAEPALARIRELIVIVLLVLVL